MYVRRPTKDRITGYVAAVFIISILLLSLSFRQRKVPFPTTPDIPAHVPFKRRATWNPDKNLTAYSTKGMVASDSDYCSEMGVNILKLGGNAADAAITTCLCIGATDTMFSSGIGGGSFITSYLRNGKEAISIDAREMAPGKAFKDMFKGKEKETMYGGLASGIPGELKGLYTLFEKHGSGNLKWSDLVLPVANYVDNGWKVDIRLAFALQVQKNAFKYFRKDWDFVFKSDKSNQLLEEGDMIYRKNFAKTLRNIAENGESAFYDSKKHIARSLASKIQEWGGIIVPEDFDMYKVNVETALTLKNFTADDLTVYSANGASSGMSLISGLSIIDKLDDFGEIDYTPIETHRLIEVMKWMASTRSYLGDIGIYNDNKKQILDHFKRYNRFISKEYLDDVISKINDNKTHGWRDYNPAYEMTDPNGTSSLSIVDKDGNAVTITTTVNLLFGSCVHDPNTGIIMNNEMDDFSLSHNKNSFGLEPSVFNFIEPYKRPLSSSAQSIVVDSKGNVELVIGAAGGSRITNAILQGIVRAFFQKKDIANIIANPRIHHQLLPDNIYFERPVEDDLIKAMNEKGHAVEVVVPMTAMNGIRVVGKEMWGQGDWWRKSGVALGV